MHILFTNNTLDFLSGSELYIYQLACEFQRRGHQVSCFSLKLGLVAARLIEAGITVTSDLSQISDVDIIHGHHPLESRIAVAFFPTVPVVFVSHGTRNDLERPGKDNFCFTRYVAISEEVRMGRLEKDGIPASKIDVVPNFVDLSRFTAKRECPPNPRRVVALSNHNASTIEGQVVRSACELAGLELKVIGMGAESVWEVEEKLEWADVVVAAARSALEGMAMGRPTVVYKYTGADGLVTPANFDQLAVTNFGGRTFRRLFTPEELAAEMLHYDLNEVAEVSRRVREERSLERAADLFLQIYDRALVEFKQSWPFSASESSLRLRNVLKDLGYHIMTFKEADLWRGNAEWGLLRYGELETQLRERNAQLDHAVSERNYFEKDHQVIFEFNTDLQRERQLLLEYNARLEEELSKRQVLTEGFSKSTLVLPTQNGFNNGEPVSNGGLSRATAPYRHQPSMENLISEKNWLQDQNTHLAATNTYLQEELSKTRALLARVSEGRAVRLLNSLRKPGLRSLASKLSKLPGIPGLIAFFTGR